MTSATAFHPPALCNVCDRAFDVTPIKLINSTHIKITGGRTTCPFCGGEASIVDATYTAIGHYFHMEAATALGEHQVARLRRLTAKLQQSVDNKDVVSEEFFDALQLVSPELAGVVKMARTGRIGYVILLICLYAMIAKCGQAEYDVRINSPTTVIQRSMDGNAEADEHRSAEDAQSQGKSAEVEEQDAFRGGESLSRHWASKFRTDMLASSANAKPDPSTGGSDGGAGAT